MIVTLCITVNSNSLVQRVPISWYTDSHIHDSRIHAFTIDSCRIDDSVIEVLRKVRSNEPYSECVHLKSYHAPFTFPCHRF